MFIKRQLGNGQGECMVGHGCRRPSSASLYTSCDGLTINFKDCAPLCQNTARATYSEQYSPVSQVIVESLMLGCKCSVNLGGSGLFRAATSNSRPSATRIFIAASELQSLSRCRRSWSAAFGHSSFMPPLECVSGVMPGGSIKAWWRSASRQVQARKLYASAGKHVIISCQVDAGPQATNIGYSLLMQKGRREGFTVKASIAE